MKYSTLWITLCKNEQDIIPFAIQYWRKVADKVIVYDNGSTDNSIELLSKEDFIEVRHFDSNGQNDFIQRDVKVNAFNEFKDIYDIIIITDLDEVFYFNDWNSVASEFVESDNNILSVPIYSLCEDDKPQYNDDKPLHQLCCKFYKQKMNHAPRMENYSKHSIFNCKAIKGLSMTVGQHITNVTPKNKILFADCGFCLHIDKGFGIEYKHNIRKQMNNNLSQENKTHKLCFEYAKDFEELKEEYINNQKNSFNINEIKLGD